MSWLHFSIVFLSVYLCHVCVIGLETRAQSGAPVSFYWTRQLHLGVAIPFPSSMARGRNPPNHIEVSDCLLQVQSAVNRAIQTDMFNSMCHCFIGFSLSCEFHSFPLQSFFFVCVCMCVQCFPELYRFMYLLILVLILLHFCLLLLQRSENMQVTRNTILIFSP